MLAVKPASARQLGYIEKLKTQRGEAKFEVPEDITSSEASQIIQKLMGKQNGNVNEARLGMAMKESCRLWNRWGRDYHGKHRERFIRETIKTYQLFTEIVERVNPST